MGRVRFVRRRALPERHADPDELGGGVLPAAGHRVNSLSIGQSWAGSSGNMNANRNYSGPLSAWL
jgi:hypothetical protein